MNKPQDSAQPAGLPAARDPGEAPGPLAGLVKQMTDRHASTPADPAQASVYPELPELARFRATWARLHARRQLQQSLAKVPENAGPLNSSNLVHRALLLMREVSPGYLEHFLAHVDALAWMEQFTEAAETARKSRVAAQKKSGRGR